MYFKLNTEKKKRKKKEKKKGIAYLPTFFFLTRKECLFF